MSTETGALKHILGKRFMCVVHDPETYRAFEIKGEEIIREWTEQMFCPVEGASTEEIQEFSIFADNPDNWNTSENEAIILVWDVGGESSGSISFYLITGK